MHFTEPPPFFKNSGEARRLERGAPGEEVAAALAEGTQHGVSVVVGHELEAEAQDACPGPTIDWSTGAPEGPDDFR